jgi:hypothetical protein
VPAGFAERREALRHEQRSATPDNGDPLTPLGQGMPDIVGKSQFGGT